MKNKKLKELKTVSDSSSILERIAGLGKQGYSRISNFEIQAKTGQDYFGQRMNDSSLFEVHGMNSVSRSPFRHSMQLKGVERPPMSIASRKSMRPMKGFAAKDFLGFDFGRMVKRKGGKL